MQKSAEFYRASRGERGIPRLPFHVRLDDKQRRKLIALSKKMEMSGAEVVRVLIERAKA